VTAKQYLVVDDTSVRASDDPKSDDYERWLHYAAGETVTDAPKHADVAGWLKSGHWTVVKPKRTPKKAAS
jgi:hypothetical protein